MQRRKKPFACFTVVILQRHENVDGVIIGLTFIWVSLRLIYTADTSVYASYTRGCTFQCVTEHTCIGPHSI